MLMIKKIKVRNKREFNALVAEYKSEGYNFITQGKKLVEMETLYGEMVVIER